MKPNPTQRNISFTQKAFDDYVYWQGQDRKTLKRINALIVDICREPFEGIGKPEPLKHDLAGYWSRRIDESHRLVYRVTEIDIRIVGCRFHYE